MTDIQKQLKEHLENGKDWEQMETPIPGVFIVKGPGSKRRPPMLYLEINPLKEDGTPMKRKGLFINNYEMLVKFSEALNDDTTLKLIKEIEKVNPKLNTKKSSVKKLQM
ncbi:MAG: hypothetical protein ACTSU4_13000 [Promethearchaeota archaeon]